MRNTATLKLTKQTDGTFTHEWSGGRRVAISYVLYSQLAGSKKSPVGSVVEIGSLKLRVVGIGFSEAGSMYRSDVIAMREGLLARFVVWYAETAYRWSETLFCFESEVLGRPITDGMIIPKWSLTGLLLRPLL